MATTSKVTPTAASPNDVKNLINWSLVELRAAIKDDGLKFFPNGIELIDVQVTVMNIAVHLKVAGPKPANVLSSTQLEPAGTL